MKKMPSLAVFLVAAFVAAKVHADIVVVDLLSSPLTDTQIYMGDLNSTGYVSDIQSGDSVLTLQDISSQALEKRNWTQTFAPQVVWAGSSVDKLEPSTVIDGSLVWLDINSMSFNLVEWPQGQLGYFGIRLRFDSQTDYRYGWVEAIRNNLNSGFTVSRMAFTDADGETLAAGQTISIVIESISRNGSISFSGAQTGTVAVIEWAANLTEQGRTNWHSLYSVSVTNAVMTNDIPMFFRVRGTPE